MCHHGIAGDGYTQRCAQYSHYPSQRFKLLERGWHGAKFGHGSGPAGIERAAQGDAHAASIALVGVRFALGQGVAGAVNLAILIHIEVVIIKELVISACGPVQVQAVYFAVGCLGEGEQVLGGYARGISYLQGIFLSRRNP